MNKDQVVDFGYQKVSAAEKTEKVQAVFRSVAPRYDLMNDVMSLGLHQLWKDFAVDRLLLRPGQRVLDLAAGTGDITQRLAKKLGKHGEIIAADINSDMLTLGRDRLINQGYLAAHWLLANAEALPLATQSLDRAIIAFGLRNVTDKTQALSELYRVLAPGGILVVLEFSHLVLPWLNPLYDLYSFQVLPRLGQLLAGDAQSYQYLAESIRQHPNQASLKTLLEIVGFEQVEIFNLNAGIVAIHRGYKL
jgi:demethylmenaquinone methyltransferase/2-methoxy-6-polyprenyl-1,4-benzoquinol methylase